jgi:3-dehydroquinate synthase
MKTIKLHTPSSISQVLIGEKLTNIGDYLPHAKCIIITDENIMRFYGAVLPDFPRIVIGRGEQHKTMATLDYVFTKLVEYEADRSTFIIGIGGGIVCDVAGFASSIYMRGLRFGFVSTTLLSQVDASVGGKNGVNFQGYKNMIGVFSQPEFVICDMEMLKTLDDREYNAGFAEIVKSAAIKDNSLFLYLEKHYPEALKRDTEVLEHLIHESVKIKATVVEADEKEKGERKKLNFGHTFAHSFESLTGMLHGEAVSIGMTLASELSVRLGLLENSGSQRIRSLLEKFNLPVAINVDPGHVLAAMKKDKKREGDAVHMVLLTQIGNAVIHTIRYNQLENLIYDLHFNS